MFLETVQQTTNLEHVTGSEYAGPCPQCGGADRFRVWNDSGRFWCRQCGFQGDYIDFLQWKHGIGFIEARRMIYGDIQTLPGRITNKPPKVDQPYRKLKPEPSDRWKAIAERFVKYAHKNLLKNAQAIQWLETERGINKESIDRFQLGWNPEDIFCKSQTWGIDSDKKIYLPAGLVIVRFNDNGELVNIRIRRSNADNGNRYYIIKASQVGWTGYGQTEKDSVVLICESDLDGILLNQETQTPVFATTSNVIKPCEAIYIQIKSCSLIIDCLDNDKPGEWLSEKLKPYLDNYVRSPIPGGKDPGEAWKAGTDLNKWLKSLRQV